MTGGSGQRAVAVLKWLLPVVAIVTMLGAVYKIDAEFRSIIHYVDAKSARIGDCISTARDMNGFAASSPVMLASYCDAVLRAEATMNDFTIRRVKFIQQYYSGILLLWVVVLITVAGVGISGLQMYLSYRIAADTHTIPDASHELIVEKDKLSVKSSFAGLMILAISFGFFSVFVGYIYPIREIRVAADVPAQVEMRRQIVAEDGATGVIPTGQGLGPRPISAPAR